MLAGFGEDRERWNGHEEVAARWGVAPITIQSGKHRTVRRRRACNRTTHQAWLWFAFNTIRKTGCWARDVYQAYQLSSNICASAGDEAPRTSAAATINSLCFVFTIGFP